MAMQVTHNGRRGVPEWEKNKGPRSSSGHGSGRQELERLNTCGYEERLALPDGAAITSVHLVPKKQLVLIGRAAPGFKEGQVGSSGTHQIEDLFSLRGTDGSEKELICHF